MKILICSLCIGGLALATTALGENKHNGNDEAVGTRPHRNAASANSVAPATSRHVTSARPTERSISKAPVRQRTYVSTPRVRSTATARKTRTVRRETANARVRSTTNSSVHRNNVNASARANANASVRNNATVNRERNFTRNRQVNVGSNFAVNRNRTRNAVVTNNWRGDRFRGQNYAVFRNYYRQWHDRDWWHHHYSTIVFVSGGWWYWNAGYWFPAWGYDASAYYPYDGPIYGYSHLSPYRRVRFERKRQLSWK